MRDILPQRLAIRLIPSPLPLALAGLVLMACTAWVLPCQAESRVRILSQGIFTPSDTATPVTDLAPCPVTRLAHAQERLSVSPDTDPAFGFLFSIGDGGSEDTDPVPLEVRLYTSSQAGGPARVLAASRHILACQGKASFAGWVSAGLGPPPPGTLFVELYQEGDLLHSLRFTVQGDARSVQAEDPGVQLVTSIPGISQSAHEQPAREPEQNTTQAHSAWAVQVSSCLVRQNAVDDAARLRAKGYDAMVREVWDKRRQATWHTVRLGAYTDKRAAEEAARDFTRSENRDAYVVAN